MSAERSGLSSSERQVPLVAGSVGPYGAYLHDGSEYTGVYAEEMSVEVSGWETDSNILT